MKILLLGAGGLLASEVEVTARSRALEVTALSHVELDITNRADVVEALGDHRPSVVVNCAAWTQVDAAEAHEDEASRINAYGAGVVASAAAQVDAAILYLSTDYVFDGAAGRPYNEGDKPNPLSAYGRSKLAGELATQRANARHYIVRTAWIYGSAGPCFPATVLDRVREGQKLRIVADQIGSPTLAAHLAGALLSLLATSRYGVHHIAGSTACSWYEFALEVVGQAGLDRAAVQPCSTAEYPRPAVRPAYSPLVAQRRDAVPLMQLGPAVAEFLKSQ